MASALISLFPGSMKGPRVLMGRINGRWKEPLEHWAALAHYGFLQVVLMNSMFSFGTFVPSHANLLELVFQTWFKWVVLYRSVQLGCTTVTIGHLEKTVCRGKGRAFPLLPPAPLWPMRGQTSAGQTSSSTHITGAPCENAESHSVAQGGFCDSVSLASSWQIIMLV